MGNLVKKIIRLKAKEFNKLREKLFPKGTYAWLLEKDGFSNNYIRTFVIEDFYYKYNDWRNQIHVHVATEDTEFISKLYTASDVTINGQVYQIEKRDIIQPDGNRAWWEFYCTMTDNSFTEDDLP